MMKRLGALIVTCAFLAAGCGGILKQPEETVVTPGNQPAPSATQTQTEAPAKAPTVTGSIQIHAGGVRWTGGGKATPPYLEGTGAISGATVIFFTGDEVLGKTTTGPEGWSPIVTLTVPVDPRLDLLRKEGQSEGLPGMVSALVTAEGYRPTVVTGISIRGAQGVGYPAQLFKTTDPIQTEGADVPKDAPHVQATAPNMTELAKLVLRLSENAPVLQGKQP